jgi:tRNA pseudouridine55 synthase
MDGKPLYEYARKGIPLPRPIEPRGVTVHSLTLRKWLGVEHSFSWPEKEFSAEDKEALERALKGAAQDAVVQDEPEEGGTANEKPLAFVLDMSVSGGTYVRSIVHDLGHALGSAGHVVTLTRTRQGRFVLDPVKDEDHGCVSWEVFEKALESQGVEEKDEDGWTEWERQVMQHLEIV